MDDLFQSDFLTTAPLAARMRPQSLYEYVGQQKILGSGSLLRRAIEHDKIGSLIFYGPPGAGKTTLAEIIAKTTAACFVPMSAIRAGKADIMKVVEEATEQLRYYEKKTILFIDEIHRFNKTQQDALLPAVENGIITFIGATTENPYFEVNKALLSRARVYELEPLNTEDIKNILIRALENKERGLGNKSVVYGDEELNALAVLSCGDARVALNALETVVAVSIPAEDGTIRLSIPDIEDAIQKKQVRYDKDGDNHYDVISAFIKSMRGSDPDAAVHWLARMIAAGEDMEFVARRIMICAAEDVGMADPQALVVATSAFQALRVIGLPEARIPLAEAAIYVALAPKSNAVITAIDEALADVGKEDVGEVPNHLRDAHHSGVKKGLGHGKGYLYPHNFPYGLVKQQYLPDRLKDKTYYRPTENGRESRIKEWLEKIKNWKC
ncbi:MAG: replication-associated recombination protein A [Bacillota bacterium]|nr:replication-associated recombination protein A [Bacillota bacterium]